MSVRGISGLPLLFQNQLLYSLSNANMQLTTDQTLIKLHSGTNWIPTLIIAVRASGAFGTACAGGIYTAASKGGTAIVAAAQSYATLTGASTYTNCALAATSTVFTGTPIVSLTTGSATALTANFFIYGVRLD